MKKTLLLICTAALLSTVTLSAAEDRFDLKVRNFFFTGFTGDAESLAKGMKMCEEALASDANNAEALVWHGAGLYYQSGQYFQNGDPQKGIQVSQQGLKEMDRAVELAPSNVGVRIPRGAALLAASRFIPDPAVTRPLIERSISDYEKVYELQSAFLDKLGSHPRGELLIGLADAYARSGETAKAASFYDRLEKEMPGTPYARKAALYRETKTAQSGCLGCHTAK